VARDAYEKLSAQMAGARSNATSPGEADKLTSQATDIIEQIRRCLTDAYNLEQAMDAYQGVPTGAQMRDLDWAWEDGIAAVNSMNRLIQQELPAWGISGLAPVPVPAR
jgi:ribosomal protein L37E